MKPTFNYLSLISSERPLTAEDLGLIDSISVESLPQAFAQAFILGDLCVARALIERREPFKAFVSIKTTEPTVTGEDGVARNVESWGSFSFQYMFIMISTGEELKELLSLAASVSGLPYEDFVSDALSMGSQIIDLVFSIASKSSPFCSTDFPILEEGVLNRPELSLILSETAGDKADQHGLSECLVWVTNEMYKMYSSHLNCYTNGLSAEVDFLQSSELLEERSKRFRLSSISKFTDRFDYNHKRSAGNNEKGEIPVDPAKDLRLHKIILGLDGDSKPTLFDMGSRAMRVGFTEREDLFLCSASTSFLASLPLGSMNPERLSDLTGKTGKYFPLCTLLNKYCKRGYDMRQWDPSHLKKVNAAPFVAMLCQDDEMRDMAMKSLGYEFIKFCAVNGFQESANSIVYRDLRVLPDLEKLFKITSDSIPIMRITSSELEFLEKNNYQFSPGTKVRINFSQDESRSVESIRRIASTAFRLTQNADCSVEDYDSHSDILETIRYLSRNKNRLWSHDSLNLQIVASYLSTKDVKDCVAVSKGVGQWEALKDIFGIEAIRPYLKQAPSAFMVRSSAQAFSL